MPTDFYRILGVAADASAEDIKRAYKQAALRWHPDRNPDQPEAEDRFKEINLAYAVLGDPLRRTEYDREQAGGRLDFDLDLDLDLQDLLRRLFGPRRKRRKRGEDLKYHLTLTFEEAARGSDLKIHVPRLVTCEHCEGVGVETDRICEACEGAGRVTREDTLLVPVPPGVSDGRRLRMNGFGNEGLAGGSPGELFVIVEVTPHPLLERDGRDVHCTVPVTMLEASLGTEVTVPTIRGHARVKVPPGTQPGDVLRLGERGIRDPRGTGDQLVTIEVVVPHDASPEMRQKLQDLADQLPRVDDPRCAEYDRILNESRNK